MERVAVNDSDDNRYLGNSVNTCNHKNAEDSVKAGSSGSGTIGNCGQIYYNRDLVNVTDKRHILPIGPCSETEYVLRLTGGGGGGRGRYAHADEELPIASKTTRPPSIRLCAPEDSKARDGSMTASQSWDSNVSKPFEFVPILKNARSIQTEERFA